VATSAQPTRIKICGIRSSESLEAALEAGADYVGLVFFPPSPRYLPLDEATPLAKAARGRTLSVALVVDADDSFLDAIVGGVEPDLLQLHGQETPERVAEIARRTRLPLIKAISVASTADAERAALYFPHVALILFDAKAPKDGPLPGGNGVAFDWRHLETVKQQHPFMLSGGLTPANVATAIRLTGADIVDVSSGVETAPGVKSPDLIREFIQAAKQ
jgi:phosphoribosylanthranilate isomerase